MRRASGSVLLSLLAVASVTWLPGCGKSDNPAAPLIPRALPDSIPQAATPTLLLERLEAAYEFAVPTDYGRLLSADFRFTFSASSDPELVTRYGNAWGKSDEMASASHLFAGFDPPSAAAGIQLSLDGLSIVDDPDHADSAAHFRKVLVPSSMGTIQLAGGSIILIASPMDLYLVRGDAAVLDATQVARSDRWYVRRWVDRAAALAVILHDARPATWGSLRDAYR